VPELGFEEVERLVEGDPGKSSSGVEVDVEQVELALGVLGDRAERVAQRLLCTSITSWWSSMYASSTSNIAISETCREVAKSSARNAVPVS